MVMATSAARNARVHGFHARMGIATCSLDSFAHGLAVPADFKAWSMGSPSATGAQRSRRSWTNDARLNNDGTVDSGGDFWTADTFLRRGAADGQRLDGVHSGAPQL